MDNKGFYTFYKYMGKEFMNLSASEEDYIEMIYRIGGDKIGEVHSNDLSQILHVKPPSVTKMVRKLSDMGLVKYKKYGAISLTEEGEAIGQFLLKRHEIVEGFLRLIMYGENFDESRILEETEKIEHTISRETVKGMANMLDFMEKNCEIKKVYMEYKDK